VLHRVATFLGQAAPAQDHRIASVQAGVLEPGVQSRQFALQTQGRGWKILGAEGIRTRPWQRSSRSMISGMAACAHCGEQNPDRARFCLACGTPVASPVVAPEEERKVVTVLFADLVGFTSRSEAMDVEDVRGTLVPYHQLLRRELQRHGGTVEKFIGDAVMALFGAPVAHEDDPERAVRAALAIQDAVAQLREQDENLDLHVRIGVNTGEALVALGARPSEGEGMASGDVVNTAARLQTAAPVDGVLVGEVTYRATDRAIRYEDIASVAAKGKAGPVRVWRALEPRSLVPEQVRAAGAPLVGRDAEVNLLVSAFERSRQDPSTQLVTVVGAPGIGKTRLVEELSAHVEELPGLIRWRRGRSLSYGEGVAFWALGEMVKVEAGALESDSAEVAAAKLRRAMEATIADGGERDWLERHLRPLVGLETAVVASAEGGRVEAFAAWRRYFEALADERPTVLLFEDAHWADDALLDFIDLLAERAGAVPLLIVCTARPELLERRPTWGGGKINAYTINLTALSDQDTARLVAELLGQALLPAETQQALLQRAEGNPLYAQEYVRMLRDQHLLVRERGSWRLIGEPEGLPESIHGLIAARLDALSRDEKRLVQDAAVIGKTAWLGAVCAISGESQWELEERIHRLERRQLLTRSRRSSVAGETEFSFSHALTQDVAYSQIRRVDRARKHECAAAWIEGITSGREDKAQLLAHHYLTAYRLREELGEATNALRAQAKAALAEAGHQADAVNAHAAATRYLSSALALTDGGDRDRHQLILDHASAAYRSGAATETLLAEALQAQLAADDSEAAAEAAYLLGEWCDRVAGDGERADTAYARGAEYAARGGYRPVASMLAYRQVFRMLVTGRASAALPFTEAAMARAEAADDVEGGALLSVWHGDARVTTGDPHGVDEMEAAAGLLAQRNHREAAVVYGNLAEAFIAIGDLARAAEARGRANQRAERLGAGYAGQAAAGQAESLYHRGEWSAALDITASLVKTASLSPVGAIWARLTRGRIEICAGETSRARRDAEEMVTAAAKSRNDELLFYGLALQALTSARQAPPEARAACRRLFARWHEIGGMPNQAPTLAEVAVIAGQSDALRDAATLLADTSRWKPALIAMADERYSDAAQAYEAIGSQPLEASAYLLAAHQAAGAGQLAHATTYAEHALAFYRRVGATAYTAEAEALLAQAKSA
jgi:class 3 adenylate cyclase